MVLLPPAFRRMRQGNVFTGVCPSIWGVGRERGYLWTGQWYPLPSLSPRQERGTPSLSLPPPLRTGVLLPPPPQDSTGLPIPSSSRQDRGTPSPYCDFCFHFQNSEMVTIECRQMCSNWVHPLYSTYEIKLPNLPVILIFLILRPTHTDVFYFAPKLTKQSVCYQCDLLMESVTLKIDTMFWYCSWAAICLLHFVLEVTKGSFYDGSSWSNSIISVT